MTTLQMIMMHWERLDEKYGDKGQLIDSIMSDIKCLKGSNDNDNHATLELIKTIERAHRDLIRLGEGEQMDNATIISMIEQKLPERILDAPDIVNDYYLNPIDWSATNLLAVALANTVYIW